MRTQITYSTNLAYFLPQYALDLKYPEYGFAQHKGYPTKKHILALHKYGPCEAHRLTFGPCKGRVIWGLEPPQNGVDLGSWTPQEIGLHHHFELLWTSTQLHNWRCGLLISSIWWRGNKARRDESTAPELDLDLALSRRWRMSRDRGETCIWTLLSPVGGRIMAWNNDKTILYDINLATIWVLFLSFHMSSVPITARHQAISLCIMLNIYSGLLNNLSTVRVIRIISAFIYLLLAIYSLLYRK